MQDIQKVLEIRNKLKPTFKDNGNKVSFYSQLYKINKNFVVNERDYVMVDFKEADIQRANLVGVDLIKANLTWANLKWANLEEANLRKANLKWTNFREANLKWADLTEAGLIKANLQGANLHEVDITGANLREAHYLTFDQLSKVKTLCNTKVDEELFKSLKKNYSVLLNCNQGAESVICYLMASSFFKKYENGAF
jgi:uncharacterized protein YjbI with pentapeptide repeats